MSYAVLTNKTERNKNYGFPTNYIPRVPTRGLGSLASRSNLRAYAQGKSNAYDFWNYRTQSWQRVFRAGATR